MGNFKSMVLAGGMGLAVLAGGLAGCQSSSHSSDRTEGRKLDDRHITQRVETALSSEPVYKFTDVDVKTYGGVVQLSGFVQTQDQKQRAGDLAQGVQGVARVVNAITLKPEMLTPTGRTGTNAAPGSMIQPMPAEVPAAGSTNSNTTTNSSGQ